MGAIDIAEVTLSRAMQRVEVSAQNIANVATPGFKAHRVFVLDDGNPAGRLRPASVDFAIGKLQQTGNPFDMAIAGSGFFVVRSGDSEFYTRNGQFQRNAEGNLATADGMLVQSATGDIAVDAAGFAVAPDGTLLRNGEPIARLKIVNFPDLQQLRHVGGGLFQASSGAPEDVDEAQIRQGMVEASNVTTADEMLSIMAALRSAEGSQKIVQAYDDLMGKVVSTIGQ